ncbi:hypothetical protein AJ80_08296 [Polytolypa hystricis UAMH7299]|uniref:TM7S3/TM198-like domain-containing protein n=1 Tax=Polytolypa hystricis (strain UAMH7299) TaxID=1447883 RepID=A0A2B7XA17_POLH7|nr:hypothetical protein AJ80_08296 [Polytolypa hystricis UAMH7299]
MRFRSLYFAIACALLAIQVVCALPNEFIPRQETPDSIATSPTATEFTSQTTQTISPTISPSGSSRGNSTVTSTISTISATPSGAPVNGSSVNGDCPVFRSQGPCLTLSLGTRPERDPAALPIDPQITPALAIAGVVLMLTGGAYALIGIKNKWVQIFLSTAFLAALSVTILIIYLITPPIKNAIQGAFFVAALITGLIFGGLALMFQEVTEGLGCSLGGFCLSMWLLAMQPGGLLQTQVGRAIFISSFTVGVYLLSFSHHTRPYGLMGSTSFAGGTAAMLGIDCFSRAGLKEFWLYLWNLNEELFPLNTRTYPVTRGIRVELAGNIVICLMGVVAQVKLWKVVKDKREKQAAKRKEEEEERNRAEEEIGRKLEEQTKQEKEQWEAVYGAHENKLNDSAIDIPEPDGRDSEQDTLVRRKSERDLKNLHPEHRSSSEYGSTGVSSATKQSSRTHLSPGTVPPGQEEIEMVDVSSAVARSVAPRPSNGSLRTGRPKSSRSMDSGVGNRPQHRVVSDSAPVMAPSPPQDIPPPFRIQFDAVDRDDSSSLAASIADSDHIPTRQIVLDRDSEPQSCSSSVVVMINPEAELASETSAFDDESHSSRSLTGCETTQPKSPKDNNRGPDLVSKDIEGAADSSQTPCVTSSGSSPLDPSGHVAAHVSEHGSTNVASNSGREATAENQTSADCDTSKSEDLTSQVGRKSDGPHLPTDKRNADISPAPGESQQVDPGIFISNRLTAESVDDLPSQVSRIVHSYRTHEWTKQLADAEPPETRTPDEIEDQIIETEVAAPVNMSELQQDAFTPQPPANLENRNSVSSETQQYREISRSGAASPVSSYGGYSAVNYSGERRYSTPGLSRTLSNRSLHRSSPNSTLLTASPDTTRNRQSVSGLPQPTVTTIHENEEAGTYRDDGSGYFGASRQEPAVHSRPVTAVTAALNPPQSPARPKSGYAFGDTSFRPFNRPTPAIFDDLPLSQRRELIHQRSHRVSPSPTPSATNPFISIHAPERVSPRHRPTQPPRTAEQREVKLANWRESVKEDLAQTKISTFKVEDRRADMLKEKYQSQRSKQQQAMAVSYRDSMLDQAMRTGGLQDVHTEAMRKMQAAANKHV